MFRAAAEHAGLEFTVEVPDAPMTVAVDRAMWSTIVTNLVANSVKYTPHGSVRIRLTATDTDAVLTVADTGRGSPPTSSRWCSTGSTGPTDGEEQGAGIGLAVVADLVRAHHGRLDLDSTPGRGSTFTVTVPIVVTSRSTHAHRRLHRGIRPAAPWAGATIGVGRRG